MSRLERKIMDEEILHPGDSWEARQERERERRRARMAKFNVTYKSVENAVKSLGKTLKGIDKFLTSK